MNTVVAKRKYKYVYVTQRDWKVHTNRVANIVERAIRISDQYLQTHSPAIQHICQEQIRKTTFSWFDTYPGDGQAMEAEPKHFTPVSVNVLERKHTNYLGNKLQLAQTLIEKNINKNVPVTHFSTAQAMAYAQNDRVLNGEYQYLFSLYRCKPLGTAIVIGIDFGVARLIIVDRCGKLCWFGWPIAKAFILFLLVDSIIGAGPCPH